MIDRRRGTECECEWTESTSSGPVAARIALTAHLPLQTFSGRCRFHKVNGSFQCFPVAPEGSERPHSHDGRKLGPHHLSHHDPTDHGERRFQVSDTICLLTGCFSLVGRRHLTDPSNPAGRQVRAPDEWALESLSALLSTEKRSVCDTPTGDFVLDLWYLQYYRCVY